MALEDAACGHTQRHRYGLETLCRFYSYGLEIRFQDSLFEDFQAVTLEDCQRGFLYALEKFWSFLHFNDNKHLEKVAPELQMLLAKYSSIEDFKPAMKLSTQPKWRSTASRGARVSKWRK